MFYLLLGIQLLVFGGLAFLLRQILTRHIIGATDHLQQLSQNYAEKEQKAQKALDDAEQYYQETQTKAQEDIETTPSDKYPVCQCQNKIFKSPFQSDRPGKKEKNHWQNLHGCF